MIKKLFSIGLIALLTAFTTGANTVVMASELSAQTPVIIQTETDISENTNKTGDTINFHVVYAVNDNAGNVAIAAGTPVKAVITKLDQKKRIGRPTELIVSGFTTELVNGRQISLQSDINKKSETRMARSIVWSAILCPLFLLMKGAAVELPAGTQATVYPAQNYSL